ncbi:MAG: hypothetical protein FWJ74_06860, partial [Gemmatimonadota bacterium]
SQLQQEPDYQRWSVHEDIMVTSPQTGQPGMQPGTQPGTQPGQQPASPMDTAPGATGTGTTNSGRSN